jgi:DNA transposition AAA+ family ATPase
MRTVYGGVTDWADTATSQALSIVFDKARFSRRIQLVQSPEQLGKSETARHYAAAHNHGRTIMVTLEPEGDGNGFSAFVRALARALGSSPDHQNLSALRATVANRLDTVSLVIVDEAHLLASWKPRNVVAFLDYLRVCVHQDHSRGVVLVATDFDTMNFLEQIRRSRGYNLGQLYGRMCGQVVEIDPEEIPLSDVALLTRRYYQAGDAALRKLHAAVTRRGLGHFGLLQEVLSRVWADAQVDRQPMTDAAVLGTLAETLDALRERERRARA